MLIEKMSETVTVSGQVGAADVKALADVGVEMIVCNRPDGEEQGQPSYEEIAAAAAKVGVKCVNIPFVGGSMNASHVEQFKACLSSGMRIHAYCRSGMRSQTLWQSSAV